LAEKILTSKTALEGERKQVTVLFADLKGSMELLADRDPEEARKLLDPVLEHMMEAVHRYEGTVNQVMGDGIMALFGAPLAHEDHAVRACYAALRMQESVKKYAEDVLRSHGVTVRIRVGLNSGEVVVRAIGGDLHMDYTAIGQTTHLAARMEQLADPRTILLPPATLQLVEGYVEVKGRGAVPVKGLMVGAARGGPPQEAVSRRASRCAVAPRPGDGATDARPAAAGPASARCDGVSPVHPAVVRSCGRVPLRASTGLVHPSPRGRAGGVDPMAPLDFAVLLRPAGPNVSVPDPGGLDPEREGEGELLPGVTLQTLDGGAGLLSHSPRARLDRRLGAAHRASVLRAGRPRRERAAAG
jgi:class 3 adenylate cyclase